MIRLLICGGRNWIDKKQIRECIKNIDPDIIIEGEAPGADTIAKDIALELGYVLNESLLSFPADWNRLGRSAGMVRNKTMLEEGKPTIIYAFHNNIWSSKGTKNMIKISLSKNIPVFLSTSIKISKVTGKETWLKE